MTTFKRAFIFFGVLGLCVAVIPWLSWLTAYSYGPGFPRSVVVAHRGNGFGHPENTIEGVRAAALNGFRSEIDVHLTADGEIVVFHDFTIHSGACQGAISSLESTLLASCGVPFLNNFSDYTNRYLVGLMIHVKGHSQPLINAVLEHIGAGDIVFIDSVNAPIEYIQAVSRESSHNPGVRIIYWVESLDDFDTVEPYMRIGDGVALSTAHLWKGDALFEKSFKVSHGMITSFRGGIGVNDRMIAEGMPLAFYETDFPNEVVTGSAVYPPPQVPYVFFAFPIIITAFVITLTIRCLPEDPISERQYRVLKNLYF